jgi:hypothetical protein
MKLLDKSRNLLSLKLFASIIFCAWSIILDMSTCKLLENAAWYSPKREKCIGYITYTNNVRSPGLYREHAKNAGAASHIQHVLALEQVGIVVHGVPIALCSDFVFQHLLMNAYMARSKDAYLACE